MGYIKIPKNLSDRITVDKNGCWKWNGSYTSDGYPQASPENGVTFKVLPFLFRLFNNLPKGRKLQFKDSCKSKSHKTCINPNHYKIAPKSKKVEMPGVGKGNNPKGHPIPMYGEENPKAKLTEGKVKKIRTLSSNGLNQTQIIKRLNLPVSGTQVGRIVSNQNWTHI